MTLGVAGWACWAWSTHASVSASQQQTLSGRGARVYTCTCVHDNIPKEADRRIPTLSGPEGPAHGLAGPGDGEWRHVATGCTVLVPSILSAAATVRNAYRHLDDLLHVTVYTSMLLHCSINSTGSKSNSELTSSSTFLFTKWTVTRLSRSLMNSTWR